MHQHARRSLSVALFVVTFFGSWPSAAFTQKGAATEFGAAIPIGHEWLATMATNEFLDRSWQPRDDDPRKKWTSGRAKNLDVSEPGAKAELDRVSQSECAS